MIPNIANSTHATVKKAWKEMIAMWGRTSITLNNADDTQIVGPMKTFCKRPRMLGLFDRTEQSYDQTRFLVLIDADDVPVGTDLQKFMRVRWDDTDHAILSITKLDLSGNVFGYRVLTEG